MKKLINFKIKRISDRCYRCFSEEYSELAVEGKTEWEALTAARKAVRNLIGTDNKQ